TFTYNGAGNQLTSTTAAAQAKVTRNTDGTVATATSPGNGTNSTSYGYTNKQQTSTTPVTGSSLGARAITYNEFGLVRTSSNGRGITTTYTYDALDRVTSAAFTGGMYVTYGYDTAGNLHTRVDEHGTTTYNYDQLYRLTFRSNSANSTFGGEINYVYDKASNLEAVNTDAGGSVFYIYDDSGVLTKVDYPEGGQRHNLQIATDSKGRRTDMWMDVGATRATWKARHQIRYDNSDRVNRVVADTGTGDTSYTRVLDTSYCRVEATTAPTCTANTANDRNKIQWQRDTLTTALTTYAYDTTGRLTQAAVTGPGAKTFNYTYNSNGNRLTATAQAQTLTYNPANQISSTGYSYDGAGNMTAQPGNGTMTYTAADQLNTVTKNSTTYTYEHAGTSNDEIISQNTPQGTYKLAYGRTNPQGLPVIESVGKGSVTASIISDPTTGQPLMLRTSTGRQALYIYDGSPGSPIGLLSSDPDQAFAYAYDPYGVPTITANDGSEAIDENPYTFAGGLQDRVTGWVHYGARYYDPKTGSFTQQDTLDTPLDRANANRYAYAGNDPINNIDPSGKACSVSDLASYAGVGAVIGGISFAIVGAVIAGVVTGSIGALAGARLLAADGVIIGGAVGLLYGALRECT
ncbi:MAG TPA: RHS repeat-associated core domain-containing protein, partial [Propionibacteriaceae bacterium]